MATITKWEPFGVSLNITATGGTVTRTSATQFTVKINASWETHYSGAKTNYGMTASSGGGSATINKFGTKASSGSGTFTGTYSVSGYGSTTKTITVAFRNFNSDNGNSATKNVSFSVSVPAWTSYTIKYNANGGSGAPSAQTKWRGVNLTISSTKPTRKGYTFQGWSLTQNGSVYYKPGATCGKDEDLTLHAVWKAGTYTVTFNANGGSLGNVPQTQTKTHDVNLTLTTAKPTRTNYNFKGWGTSASSTTVSYSPGDSYTSNSSITLHAIWELGYTKPRITGVTIYRCDTNQNPTDEGVYASVQFKWATDLTITGVKIEVKKTTDTTWYSTTNTSVSGTSGTFKARISASSGDDYAFDTESAYQIRVTVSDGSDTAHSTTVLKTLPSICLPIDIKAEGKGVSFGKVATTKDLVASAWSIGVGNKEAYGDSNTGVLIHKEGYIHLQRSTASGGKPYIGFLIDDDASVDGALTTRANIRYNKDTDQLEFIDAGGYKFGNDVYLTGGSSAAIKALRVTSSNQLMVGKGSYDVGAPTYIYGRDIYLYVKSAGAHYYPYYAVNDSISISIATAGYLTNGSKDVSFIVPLSKPIIGNPAVTVATVNGFTLRQGTKYTHGSSATQAVSPASYSASIKPGGVYILASFSTTTNATNNDAIGINWSGTITFS